MSAATDPQQHGDSQIVENLTLLGIAPGDATLYARLRRVALTMQFDPNAEMRQLGDGLASVAEAWLTDLYSGDAADDDRKTLLQYLQQYDVCHGT